MGIFINVFDWENTFEDFTFKYTHTKTTCSPPHKDKQVSETQTADVLPQVVPDTNCVIYCWSLSLYCGCVFMCEWTDVRVHAGVVKTLTADPWRLLMCKSVRSKIVILLSPLQIRSHSECFYFNWLLEFQPYVCGIYHMSIIKWSPVSYWHTKGLKEAYQRWGWIS